MAAMKGTKNLHCCHTGSTVMNILNDHTIIDKIIYIHAYYKFTFKNIS